MLSVVVDASLVLRLVIDEPGSVAVQALWEAWKENRTFIAAPTLLIYEAVNGLHRAWKGGWLTVDEVKESITLLIASPSTTTALRNWPTGPLNWPEISNWKRPTTRSTWPWRKC